MMEDEKNSDGKLDSNGEPNAKLDPGLDPDGCSKAKARWNTLEVWDWMIVVLLMAIWTFAGFNDGRLPGIPLRMNVGLGIFSIVYIVYFAVCLVAYKTPRAIRFLGIMFLVLLVLFIISNQLLLYSDWW